MYLLSCLNEQRVNRLASMFSTHSLCMYGDFSGVECTHWGWEAVVPAFQHMFEINAEVLFARSCDVNHLCQRVLRASMPQACVFADIADRLELSAQEQATLKATVSNKETLGPGDYAWSANSILETLLFWEHVFDKHTSPCLTHGCRCPVIPSQEPDVLDVQLLGPGAACKPRILINNAGTVCKGWSTVNHSRLREAHSSEVAHNIWLAERHHVQSEHCFFQECTVRYPWQTKLRDQLEQTHEVRAVKVCPSMFGWPVRRPRHYAFGLNKKLMRWVGPSDPQEDFLATFGARVSLAIEEMFCVDDPGLLYEELAPLARQRGFHLDKDKPEFHLSQFMPPGALLRWREYLAKNRCDDDDAVVDCEGSFVADVDHWPNTAASDGHLLNTQLTHGTICSPLKPRPMLSWELWSCHGFLFLEKTTDFHEHAALFNTLRAETNRAERQELLGNGMHLLTWMAWQLYCLSNIVVLGSQADLQEFIESETVDDEAALQAQGQDLDLDFAVE